MDEKKLDYETAYRAVHGDHDAQMKVLAYYDIMEIRVSLLSVRILQVGM